MSAAETSFVMDFMADKELQARIAERQRRWADSPYRCRQCGKRKIIDNDREDVRHECLNCG